MALKAKKDTKPRQQWIEFLRDKRALLSKEIRNLMFQAGAVDPYGPLSVLTDLVRIYQDILTIGQYLKVQRREF